MLNEFRQSTEKAKYNLIQVNECNMCGAKADRFDFMGYRLDARQGFNPSKKKGLTTRVVRCRSCGLICTNPMPRVVNLNDHYNIPPEYYWDETAVLDSPGYFNQQIDWYRRLSLNTGASRALDIGAGLGKGMKALMKAGFKVMGIEPSQAFAVKAIEINGIPEEQLLVCPVEEASFKTESFDFINFGAVLEPLYDPAYCIGRALRWLNPSGLIHIEVPSASWLVARTVNLIYKLSGQHYVTNLSPMHNPYHLYEFTLEAFIKNGRKLGYEIADYKYYVGKTFLAPPLSNLVRPLMQVTKTGMQLAVWLKKSS